MTAAKSKSNAIAILVDARRDVFFELVSEVRALSVAPSGARPFWRERCDLSETGWNNVQGAIKHLQRTGGA